MLFRNTYRVGSSRLAGWDYSSPGYYFITACTRNRVHFFGEIVDGKMRLNDCGKIVYEEWHTTGRIRDTIVLDEFTVMPNHIHGIIRLLDNGCPDGKWKHEKGNGCRNGYGRDVARYVSTGDLNDYNGCANILGTNAPVAKKPVRITMSEISPAPASLSTIMRSFKSAITRRVNKLLGTPGAHVFQPRFHDHIIRNEKELFLVRHYIRNNPANWEIDDELNDAIKHHDRRRSPWYVRMP